MNRTTVKTDFPSNEPSAAFAEAVSFFEDRVNFELYKSLPYHELESRLDRLASVLDQIGGPQRKLLTVHVGGTKGKGSTCAMIASVLQESGYSVGLFCSPHVETFLERFVISGERCRPEEFTEITFWLRDRLREIDPAIGEWLTFFELSVLFAFVFFERHNVDVAVLEVGLGGRLDATRVCNAQVTAITSISFDHVEQLGPSIEEITTEKSGIIKLEKPVLSSTRNPVARRIIAGQAAKMLSPAYFIDDHFPVRTDLRLSMPGKHQLDNAALAEAVIRQLTPSLKPSQPGVSEETIRKGLEKVKLPVRVEVFEQTENQPTVIFDGAHNRSSLHALVKTIRHLYPQKRIHFVFGSSLEKDIEGMLMTILDVCSSLVLTQHSSNAKRFPAQGLLTIALSLLEPSLEWMQEFSQTKQEEESDHHFLIDSVKTAESGETGPKIEVIDSPFEAFRQTIETVNKNDVVCVVGSIFLTGEIRKYYLETFLRLSG